LSVLPIYLYGTGVLRKKAKPVQKISIETIKLIVDMFETMHKAQGVGLAANQVGSLERVIVIDVSEVEGMEHIKPFPLINPEIISREGSSVKEEGCLSLPDLRDEVQRDEKIVVRYKDTNFHTQELEAGGLLARAILHELDHLNGVLFIDHLSKDKLKLHKEELKQIQHGQAEVTYPVVIDEKIVVS
jgi:peptide deformylase